MRLFIRVAIVSFIGGFFLQLGQIYVDRNDAPPPVKQIMVEDAQAHGAPYCGHKWVGGTKFSPYGGVIEWRELYAWGWGAGPHYHFYRTFAWVASKGKWVFLHSHTRQCRSHPV